LKRFYRNKLKNTAEENAIGKLSSIGEKASTRVTIKE
jgi:hypothetical protein